MHRLLNNTYNQLIEEGQVFALAQIVRRVNPSSGKPGDKAIITAEGKIHGWIGGGCTKGIVLKESLLALKDKKSRLVSIRPGAIENLSNYSKTYTMTCQSGGEVDVFIEPIIPNPMITIFGSSHIARALAALSITMGYKTTMVLHDINNRPDLELDQLVSLDDYDPAISGGLNDYLIVSTQGEGDLDALKAAIDTDSCYLGFVSSRMKAAGIYSDLRKLGVTMDQLKRIKTPAGIDINAKTPEEVSISILAEIVGDFRQEQNQDSIETPLNVGEDYYLNPVCNIPIQKSTAKHVIEYQNEKVYFCCDGCKVSFEKQPSAYITS